MHSTRGERTRREPKVVQRGVRQIDRGHVANHFGDCEGGFGRSRSEIEHRPLWNAGRKRLDQQWRPLPHAVMIARSDR